MANYKISGLTAYPNSTFAATDKFEVSYLTGGIHYSRYLTGTQIFATLEKTSNKQNSLAIDGTGVKFPTVDAINSFGIVVDLIDALTVNFALSYAYKINSVTNITNAPTTTILDDGVAYTLTNTVAANSVMTVTVSTAARVQLNIQKV
jgi:hypothetical protein